MKVPRSKDDPGKVSDLKIILIVLIPNQLKMSFIIFLNLLEVDKIWVNKEVSNLFVINCCNDKQPKNCRLHSL